MMDDNTTTERKQNSIRNFEHIIWDYNGTLLNDLDLCVEVINILLHKRGLNTLSRLGYQNVFDFPVRDYYEKIGFDFQQESFELVGTEFIDEYNKRQDHCTLQTGATETLQILNDMGVPQSILSARLQKSLDQELDTFGIRNYFTHVYGLDHHYADGKLERGRQLLDQMKIPTGKILLIGDTLHDFHVAQQLGFEAVLIAHGHHSYERLRKESEHVYHALSEFRMDFLK